MSSNQNFFAEIIITSKKPNKKLNKTNPKNAVRLTLASSLSKTITRLYVFWRENMKKKLGLVSLYISFNDNNINKLLKIIYFF